MKKKLLLTTIILSLILFLLPTQFVSAASIDSNINSSKIIAIEYLDDGSYLVTELYENDNDDIALLSTVKAANKVVTRYSSSGEALCALKLTATFSYDGSTVSCVGTTHTEYSYDDAWSVEDVTTSHSSSSTSKASATGNCNFVKRFLGITTNRISASTTIYCDVNGNLS